jgi:hypothetical protein
MFETATGYVAIELKNGARWEKKFNRGMYRLSEELGKEKVTCYGVFMGERQLTVDGVTVYPALDFLRRLWSGEIVGTAI